MNQPRLRCRAVRGSPRAVRGSPDPALNRPQVSLQSGTQWEPLVDSNEVSSGPVSKSDGIDRRLPRAGGD
jgi:hypothetical protein